MTWRSILISKPARLSLQQQHLLIEQDEAIPVPLEDIAVIVVEAREVVLTAVVGIGTIWCNAADL